MLFLGLGLLLLVLKYLEVGIVADWSWWIVLSPFAMAIVWWAWADATGYTRRKAIEREDQRRDARIERQRAAIGKSTKRRR